MAFKLIYLENMYFYLKQEYLTFNTFFSNIFVFQTVCQVLSNIKHDSEVKHLQLTCQSHLENSLIKFTYTQIHLYAKHLFGSINTSHTTLYKKQKLIKTVLQKMTLQSLRVMYLLNALGQIVFYTKCVLQVYHMITCNFLQYSIYR